jgi:hypothetical protein
MREVVVYLPQVLLFSSVAADKQLEEFRLGYKRFIPNLFPSHHSRIAPPRKYIVEIKGGQIQGSWSQGRLNIFLSWLLNFQRKCCNCLPSSTRMRFIVQAPKGKLQLDVRFTGHSGKLHPRMALAACHHHGAWNFEVASRYLDDLCTRSVFTAIIIKLASDDGD